ncbi:MAG TPA: hypothetical protein VHH34_05680, partial [Pseudonocardiaceae bacterium]|nr:hypothetical protein [Pseudonocardiaceae bacterium]
AGVAIEHAELLDEARRRQNWLRASTTITTLLLAGETPEAVRAVAAGHARQLDAAAAAAITTPTEDPNLLRVAAGSGRLDPQVVGEFLSAGDALVQLAHSGGGAIVVERLGDAERLGDDPKPPGSGSRTFGVEGLGPTVAAPLGTAVGDELLLVARGPQQHFQPAEVEMIASFAAHVGLALDLAEARRRRDVERLVEDRERIAAHLSERAMRALLEISTMVHGLTARMRSPHDAQLLAEQANRLDRVLRDMQRAIFGLQVQPGVWHGSAAR